MNCPDCNRITFDGACDDCEARDAAKCNHLFADPTCRNCAGIVEPPPPVVGEWLERHHAGWERAWRVLRDAHGDVDADYDGERWQYMGTYDGEHCFRLRGFGSFAVRAEGGDYAVSAG